MTHVRCLLLSALIASAPTVDGDALPDDLADCLHEATVANSAHELDRQRELLEWAETLSGRPEDVADVQRRLAVLDWKYEERDERARERLRRATSGPEPGEAWLELARLERARGRFAEARRASLEASRVGAMSEVRRRGRITAALASTAEAGEQRRRGETGRTDELREAQEVVRAIVETEPGLLVPSKTLLRASVLLEDGGSALLAWHSYYHVDPSEANDALPNAVAEAGADLRLLLPRLGGKAFTPADHVALVDALRASHFHEAAALLALDPGLDLGHDGVRRADPRIRDALAYADFVRELRDGVNELYRQRALGRRNRSGLDKLVRDTLRRLHREVERSRFPSTPKARWAWLSERFGAYGSIGTTAGYYDLHMGHVVIDETRPVTQYGETADLRFVALDHMVSNGFQTWAWETGAQHGGWAGPDTMWQVRPGYTDGAINTWRQMHDEESRAEFFERLERESAKDEVRARENPIAHLPGLVDRLNLQAAEALLVELAARKLSGPGLRLAFIQEASRSVLEYSIFAHEGRHAIDRRLGIKNTTTLEYRAKLSQVAFAPRPRLALAGILSPVTGNETPHGQANERALEGLLEWMGEHADEIEGLDPERPLLPQLDKMTDDQLRAAFRSMDPLAR